MGSTVEDFSAFFGAIDVNVPDRVLSDHCEFGETDPAPEDGDVRNLSLLELFAGVNVEDLDDSCVTSSGSYSDDVALFVHEDAICLHVSSIDFEALGGVDNSDLLKE